MVPDSLSSRARRLATGLCVCAALASGGCGSFRSDHRHRGSTRAAAASTTPSVSTAPSTSSGTTSSTATTATLPGSGRPTVTIGDKNTTEQFVLGQLYLQALQAQGFTVDLNQNIGPPAIFTHALKTGSLAMYPEYLDAFDSTIAGLRGRFVSRADAYRAGQSWATAHGLELLAPTPFADTDAIGVTDAYAADHHLRSVQDLRRVGATLALGGTAELSNRSPGLPALSNVYGVVPAEFEPIGVGDQYGALDDRTIDAAYVNTTDGQLASGDYRLLRDPRRIFGWGNVVPVVSSAAAAKEGPAFADTIERVDRTLTLSTMRELNNAVDGAGQDPVAVAKQYLETHGLLTPTP